MYREQQAKIARNFLKDRSNEENAPEQIFKIMMKLKSLVSVQEERGGQRSKTECPSVVDTKGQSKTVCNKRGTFNPKEKKSGLFNK